VTNADVSKIKTLIAFFSNTQKWITALWNQTLQMDFAW
jgi:hypothetical protein